MPSTAKWHVGQDVFVYEPGYGRDKGTTVPGVVTKVGRVNVTVSWEPGTYSREANFRFDTGIENSAGARSHPMYALRLYTAQDLEDRRARRAVEDRLAKHEALLEGRGRNKVSTDDLARLADLLDEITATDA